MLMKLTPEWTPETQARRIRLRRSRLLFPETHKLDTKGQNFTNILQKTFTPKDPKSAKEIVSFTVFFALLGSARVKASHKMLVKLTGAGAPSFWYKTRHIKGIFDNLS